MVKLGTLAALATLLGGGTLAPGDFDFTGRDCQPGPCTVADGALQLCATGAGPTKRLHLERLVPARPTYAHFVWDPGSLGPDQLLRVHFRHDQVERHTITFDAGRGLIATSGGLPPAEVPFAFAAGDHLVEVVHLHNLKVYIGGVDPEHLLLDLPLAPEAQDATGVVFEARDDGSCHRFREVAGVPYAWACPVGRCELDTRGLQLCGWGTDRLVWDRPLADGGVAFDWDPTTFGASALTVFLRADAPEGQRHGVTFDLSKDGTVRFTEGLQGLPLRFHLGRGAMPVVLTHRTNDLGLGEVQVRLDDSEVPDAVGVYATPGQGASQLAFEAANEFGGCQWIERLAVAAAR